MKFTQFARLCMALAMGLMVVSSAAHSQTLSSLYSFTGGSDGADPAGGVITDKAGNLYGETDLGGTATCANGIPQAPPGCGTVYSLSPSGALNVLVSFTGTNGANAFYNTVNGFTYGTSGLVLVGTTLYGSAFAGGASNAGLLFSVHTDGTGLTILHQFTGADGRSPQGNLRQGPNGLLYGITQFGGAGDTGSVGSGNGVLFSLKTDGTYAIVHPFTSGSDGANPVSLLISNGTLVGSTLSGGGATSKQCPTGCGTLYTYAPSSAKLTVVMAFSGNNGANPYVGSVGPMQTLYGVAGNIFSVSPTSPFTYIAKFHGLLEGSGAFSGPLYTQSGTLYGVTYAGPAGDSGYGTLYSVISGKMTVLYVFGSGGPIGAVPHAQPIITSVGSLVGTTTSYADCNVCGAIWKYTQ